VSYKDGVEAGLGVNVGVAVEVGVGVVVGTWFAGVEVGSGVLGVRTPTVGVWVGVAVEITGVCVGLLVGVTVGVSDSLVERKSAAFGTNH